MLQTYSKAVKNQSLYYWRYAHPVLHLVIDLFWLTKQDGQEMLMQKRIIRPFEATSSIPKMLLQKKKSEHLIYMPV